MSLEVFEKLEAKVQQAIDTITLLQMEIEASLPVQQVPDHTQSRCLAVLSGIRQDVPVHEDYPFFP